MKSLKTILLVAFSTVTLVAFAQEDTGKTVRLLPKTTNQPCESTNGSRSHNLSVKEKMKVEIMKEHACSKHKAVLNDDDGRYRKRGNNQHFSLKENMKSSTMKEHAGSRYSNVTVDKAVRGNTNAIYQNLSLKEKMKREAMKQ